jgi:hypothetical protein
VEGCRFTGGEIEMRVEKESGELFSRLREKSRSESSSSSSEEAERGGKTALVDNRYRFEAVVFQS